MEGLSVGGCKKPKRVVEFRYVRIFHWESSHPSQAGFCLVRHGRANGELRAAEVDRPVSNCNRRSNVCFLWRRGSPAGLSGRLRMAALQNVEQYFASFARPAADHVSLLVCQSKQSFLTVERMDGWICVHSSPPIVRVRFG